MIGFPDAESKWEVFCRLISGMLKAAKFIDETLPERIPEPSPNI